MTTTSEQTLPTQNKTPTRSEPPNPQGKKSKLIKFLSRKSGMDVPTISAKLEWQPHTTRAALSGLRKAGFDVAKEAVGNGKPARYPILPPSTQIDESIPDAE